MRQVLHRLGVLAQFWIAPFALAQNQDDTQRALSRGGNPDVNHQIVLALVREDNNSRFLEAINGLERQRIDGTDNEPGLLSWRLYSIRPGLGSAFDNIVEVIRRLSSFGSIGLPLRLTADQVEKYTKESLLRGIVVWPEIERTIAQSTYEVGPFCDAMLGQVYELPPGRSASDIAVGVLDSLKYKCPNDAIAHGMIVGAVIARIALGSKIIFFDSCKSNSSSANLCTDSEILKGINAVYRQEKSRSVLFNFSFGSQTSSPLLLGYVSFVTKFARIYTPDNSDKLPPGLIVAAAGNVTKPPRAKDKEVIKVYPAFYSFEYDELQILSVRSVEQNNQNKDNWRLSDFGYSGLNHPFDISAPGRRVHVPDNRYPVSGTSFATPVVTGALALLQKSGVPIQKLTSCIGEIVNKTPDRRLDLDRFYAALENLKQFMNCN